jgi:hypothetical protein
VAYLREIEVRRCYAHGCNRRASHGLYGERNEPLGDYCARHAHQALRAYSNRRRASGKAHQDAQKYTERLEETCHD